MYPPRLNSIKILIIDGHRLVIPGSMIDTMFREVAPYVPIIEEFVEVEEPVAQ